jgi:acetate kinase
MAAMAAATGGTDAIVFTGGVGEGSAVIRAETAAGLDWMGVAIDESVAAEGDRDVSAAHAAVRTLVIHAREDLQIAAECRRLLE